MFWFWRGIENGGSLDKGISGAYFEKTYLALVRGVPAKEYGEIKAPLEKRTAGYRFWKGENRQ